MRKLLFWVFLGYLIHWLLGGDPEDNEPVVRPRVPDNVPYSEITGCRSVDKDWSWTSLSGEKYQMPFHVCQETYLQSIASREAMLFPAEEMSDIGYARYMYTQLLQDGTFPSDELLDGYRKIIRDNKLNYGQALNLIISSIQEIPYTLVINEKCPFRLNGVTYENTCAPIPSGQGCCGNIQPFGIFSPTEFLYHEAGDCDTRTVFAYAVLSELGFDVTIINGEEHSMLGVYLPKAPPSGSDFVRSPLGKKYYVWELTGKDWELGVKPDVNLDYWEIVLP